MDKDIKTDIFENSILIIYGCWASVGILLLVLILTFSNQIYACKKSFINNWILLAVGVVFLFVLYYFLEKSDRKITKKIIFIISSCFLLFQILAVRHYCFYTGWDVWGIERSAFEKAYGVAIVSYPFTVYPNNVLLTYVFSVIIKIAFALKLTRDQAYLMLLYFQCILSCLTGIITFNIAEKLTDSSRSAFACYILFLILCGLSPWVSIPYSDATGLFFPAFIFAVYLYEPSKIGLNLIKWLLIGFLSYFGYKIKPTIAIVFIAMCIIEFVKMISSQQFRKGLFKFLLIFLGILLSMQYVNRIYYSFNCDLHPEEAFGPAHFFMMGLNEKDMGIWSGEDVAFSESIHSAEERNIADLQRARERISRMGLFGLMKQYERKLLTTFNDGTFAWWEEGDFFIRYINQCHEKIGSIFRNIYIPKGINYEVFINFEQAVWVTVFLFSILSVFAERRPEVSVLLLTLLGLVIYIILFEARARYLYVYLPFFLVLSSVGIRKIFTVILDILHFNIYGHKAELK